MVEPPIFLMVIPNCFECLAFPHNVKGFTNSQNFLQSSTKHMTFFYIFLGLLKENQYLVCVRTKQRRKVLAKGTIIIQGHSWFFFKFEPIINNH